ncbi:YhgE/Pip domain-containing protein, partial [Bifidobacterium adolescentis]
MHNVLQILRRDFKRLVTVPAAWVIMIGLILIPPLYAWFNIYGFWNPYGNTDSIKVA